MLKGGFWSRELGASASWMFFPQLNSGIVDVFLTNLREYENPSRRRRNCIGREKFLRREGKSSTSRCKNESGVVPLDIVGGADLGNGRTFILHFAVCRGLFSSPGLEEFSGGEEEEGDTARILQGNHPKGCVVIEVLCHDSTQQATDAET